MAIQPPLQATTPEFVPMAPARTEDSGLPVARLADLLLKHIYFKSPMSAKDWAAALCLPYTTVTPAIQSLVEQGWCQTIGRMAGPAMSHDFGESLGYLITDPGRLRARDVLARDHYVGPAPVPFLQYEVSVRAQVSQADVTAAWLTRALQHLTLSNDLLVQLGPPVNARAPLFLYGAPGNGKTTIAEACAELLGEPIYIPYAIDIEGQVMRLYDPLHHQRVQRQMPMNFDARWVLIKRPFVKAGGAPFEAMVVFSTNLEPASLVDEAFLRRVRYKIHVPDPTAAEFRQIFERACKEFEIVFNEVGYNYVLDRYYKPFKRPYRGCQ